MIPPYRLILAVVVASALTTSSQGRQLLPSSAHCRHDSGELQPDRVRREAALALARAIARPAGLILLDEPTAALDEQTENRVLAGLAGALRGRTVVLVTHRLAPVSLADIVISLGAGSAGGSTGRTAGSVVEPDPAQDAEPLTAVGPW